MAVSLTSEHSEIDGPVHFRKWVDGEEIGWVAWKRLPDGTPVRLVLRDLGNGNTAVVPDPLYVEVWDRKHARTVVMEGRIGTDCLPSFRSVRLYSRFEDPQNLDLSLGIASGDLRRWSERAMQYGTIATGDATGPKRNPGIERLEADRQIARDMVRHLRRKRGRPGRPGWPWEEKEKAHRLNRIENVAQADIAAQYNVSRQTVGRWVKEVDAAMESQEEGDQ